MKKSCSRILLTSLLFAAFVFPLKAQERFAWFAEASVLAFPENNGNHSDPMHILPSPGAGIGIPLFGNMRLEITLDMYFAIYGYDFILERPVPRAIENRSASVWGSVLGLQGSYVFRLGNSMAIRAEAGMAADLRLVLLAADLNEALDPIDDIKKEVQALKDYFWGGARWLLPVAGTGMDFTLNNKIKLGFDLRVWIPMYKLFTDDDAPAIDGWRFGIGARITFR